MRSSEIFLKLTEDTSFIESLDSTKKVLVGGFEEGKSM